MARLILARHGETDWNRQGRWQGQTDVPLNAVGREQAAALARLLRNEPLAAIYSSRLQRSVETARLVAAPHKLNVCRDERLNEMDLGTWQGLTRREIEARDPELFGRWKADPRAVAPPGGESVAQLERRVLAAVQEIADAYWSETVCIVGHKMANAIIRSHFLDLPLIEALLADYKHAQVEVINLPTRVGTLMPGSRVWSPLR